MKASSHFSVSSKCTEALNEFFYCVEMEGDNLFGHMPVRWVPLLPATEKVLKCWPAIKTTFSKCGTRGMPLFDLETY